MSAKEMFLRKNFNCITDNEDEIRYSHKTDYETIHIEFRKKLKDYCVTSKSWIPENYETWTTMMNNNEFRDEFDKHCAKFGHWQLESYTYIDYELLQAINKQIEELGWNNE